ncbi:MAG: MotA/TolQ/ExbB proton channel family protein [Verrucomicrobiales bacterium]|nr:MotA/TolQ/ExbB proton channel family protein [Verrucomicrobiales bacterium]
MLINAEHFGRVIPCPACNERIQMPSAAEVSRTYAAASSKRQQQANESVTVQTNSDFANVHPWSSLGIGVGFAVLFYLAMFLIKGSYLSDLFLARGWVPYIVVIFFGWSVGILTLKYMRLRTQRIALLVEVLPVQISHQINSSNLSQFIEHITRIPERLSRTYMVTRIRRGLEHFAIRRSNPDVARMMQSQSDIDVSAIGGSYSLVKSFLWAIPILGFIGTVIGISAAISGFSGQTEAAQDMAVLMESINNVTGGLGVAFDTTLVALVISIMLAFPVSAMQKAEEDLLNSIDEYCNENLLKRLDDAGGMAEVASNTEGILVALKSAVSSGQEEILEEFRQAGERMAELQDEQHKLIQRTSENVDSKMASLVTKTGNEAARAFDETAHAVRENLGKLGEGIAELNKVLKQLDGKQVVIEKKKSKWFGRG